MKKIITVFVLIVSHLAFASGESTDCGLPEVITYQKNSYNKLVCEAGKLQEKGKYREALLTLEKASDEDIFEEPNIFLFPRLALLHAKVGDHKKAETYLKKAKLSLEILYGLARCDLDYEHSPGVQLENLYDQGKIGIIRGRELIKFPVAKEIFFRACQENTVDFYPQNYDLNRLLDDPLLSLYRKARAVVLTKEHL